ncbi:polyADP-ribose polymerase [Yasminevirus sp. GU-2018]|uniref:PolyADP-ribose polymerase n=1 Tax=Yasminevirus sp. GU-2018 TaxID=2420051 RepID=A0A5K0U9M2_9VIRU|nr:polyADP-ribose polymerase [Yasminevirus sp. GU-2018]
MDYEYFDFTATIPSRTALKTPKAPTVKRSVAQASNTNSTSVPNAKSEVKTEIKQQKKENDEQVSPTMPNVTSALFVSEIFNQALGERVKFSEVRGGVCVVLDLTQISSYSEETVMFTVENGNLSQDKDTDPNEVTFRISPDDKKSYLSKHFLKVVLTKWEQKGAKSMIHDVEDSDSFVLKISNLKSFAFSMNECVESTPDLFRVCPMCLKPNTYSYGYLRPCDICKPDSFSKVHSNVITDLYNRDPNLLKLLLYTSIEALGNKQRFTPLPAYCKSNTFEEEYLGKTAINYDMSYYINKISAVKNDTELMRSVSQREFMFLKHVITSNNTKLNYFDDEKSDYRDVKVDKWDKKQNKYVLFTVDHPPEKQKLFDTDVNVTHMFHGSAIHNWYSIMRNGLKNFSGTAMMSHGQAYGPGIYLATDTATATGYCRNTSNDSYYVIGVVQLLNSEKYKKTPNIYVVPEESDVLLKYMILFTSRNTAGLQDVEKYLTRELPASIKTSIGNTIGIVAKRLRKESDEFLKRVKKLQKTDTRLVNVDLKSSLDNPKETSDQSDSSGGLIRWTVDITLKSDKNNKDNNNLSVEASIVFPRTFPSSPCIVTCTTRDIDLSTKSLMIRKNTDNTSSSTSVCTWFYEDPILSNDHWRADVRVGRILEQMLVNLLG